MDQMIRIVAEMATMTNLPIVAQPNAGLPNIEGGVADYPEGPEIFGQGSRELRKAGARVIGGCCGTGPKHIKATVGAVRKR